MPSINKDTGKLFGTGQEQRALDLQQSVADRVLTVPGSQPARPDYGSLAAYVGREDLITVTSSIQNALAGDPRVERLDFVRSGPRLRVIINGGILGLTLGPGAPATPAALRDWSDEWGEDFG